MITQEGIKIMSTNTRGPVRASTNPITTTDAKKKFVWKKANDDWHDDVKGLYNALKKSEHADQFEETDMYHARLISQLLSDAMDNQVDVNAAHIKNLFTELKELGTTLGTRKRLALEVEKVKDNQAASELMANVFSSIITGKKVGQ